MLALAGCGLALPAPAEIPIGGVRAAITGENLAAARSEMDGGLLEPGWLPDGFVLVHADYIGRGNRIDSVDLFYEGGTNYLHVWQSHVSPDDLGAVDPVRNGAPLEGTDWNANPLPEAQVGRPGVVDYSTRLDDGRTVTVDSDLDVETMRRVLDLLYLRDG